MRARGLSDPTDHQRGTDRRVKVAGEPPSAATRPPVDEARQLLLTLPHPYQLRTTPTKVQLVVDDRERAGQAFEYTMKAEHLRCLEVRAGIQMPASAQHRPRLGDPGNSKGGSRRQRMIPGDCLDNVPLVRQLRRRGAIPRRQVVQPISNDRADRHRRNEPDPSHPRGDAWGDLLCQPVRQCRQAERIEAALTRKVRVCLAEMNVQTSQHDPDRPHSFGDRPEHRRLRDPDRAEKPPKKRWVGRCADRCWVPPRTSAPRMPSTVGAGYPSRRNSTYMASSVAQS
jgi:hypothetical protein